MAKQIQVGPIAIGLGVTNGQAQVTADVSLAASIGGGAAAGVATSKVVLHAEEDVSAKQLADLAILALEHAFPSGTSLLEMAKSGIDAELAKLTV